MDAIGLKVACINACQSPIDGNERSLMLLSAATHDRPVE